MKSIYLMWVAGGVTHVSWREIISTSIALLTTKTWLWWMLSYYHLNIHPSSICLYWSLLTVCIICILYTIPAFVIGCPTGLWDAAAADMSIWVMPPAIDLRFWLPLSPDFYVVRWIGLFITYASLTFIRTSVTPEAGIQHLQVMLTCFSLTSSLASLLMLLHLPSVWLL